MDKQAKEAKESVKQLSFTGKIQYFWDYHKWHLFAVVIALILIGTTVAQIVTRVEYDVEIAYYGAANFTEEQAEKLEKYLSEYIQDIDGNGEKNVNVSVVEAEAPGMNTGQFTEYQAAVGQKFSAEIAARVYDAYIFDEAYYNYAGPDSDFGIIESSFEMSQLENMQNLLGIGDKPLYLCTCVKRVSKRNDEVAQAKYDNAIAVQNAIKGE